jgi:hypothetical protein
MIHLACYNFVALPDGRCVSTFGFDRFGLFLHEICRVYEIVVDRRRIVVERALLAFESFRQGIAACEQATTALLAVVTGGR